MGEKIYGKKLLELIPKLDYVREVVFGCGGGEPARTVRIKDICDLILEIRDTIQEECSEDYRMVFRNKAWEEERKKRSEANQMEPYFCPECGTEMKESPIDAEVVRLAPQWEGRINLCCPKCQFSIMKNHYKFLYDLGRYSVAELPPKEKDKDKRKMSVPEMIFHAKNGDEMPEDAYMPEYVAEKRARRKNHMELLKLESADGDKTIYLNPVYIESIIDSDDGCCLIFTNGDNVSPYKVRMKADDLAVIVARVKVPSRYPFGPGGF